MKSQSGVKSIMQADNADYSKLEQQRREGSG